MFTGTRGFDGSIQCQQVCLRGNIIDGVCYASNLAGMDANLFHSTSSYAGLFTDGMHALDGGFHYSGAVAGYLSCLPGIMTAVFDIAEHILDVDVDLPGNLRSLINRQGLLLSA